MLSLETFWKTLIFKVNRDPFHLASPPLSWPGSKVLHIPPPHSPSVVLNCRNTGPSQGAFGMETPERGTLTFQGSHALPSEYHAVTPDCIQEVLSGFKMPTLHLLVRRLHLPKWRRWFGDVVNCCKNWQLISDWLQSNSENQSPEDAPGLESQQTPVTDHDQRSGNVTSISSMTEEASGLITIDCASILPLTAWYR